MKTLFFLLLITLFFPAANDCFALQNKIIEDTSTVELRKPSAGTIDKFRSDKDFVYNKAKDPVGFWEILSAWITEILERIFTSGIFNFFTSYVRYVIIGIAIIIVVYVLRKSKLQGLIYSKEETSSLIFQETEENIHTINFDTIINNAIANKEYRIAIRYYYLKSLKLLTDKELIEWKINKTNSQYVREIKERELKTPFSELTHIFEWIWYGEIAVESPLFENAQKSFLSFNENVQGKK